MESKNTGYIIEGGKDGKSRLDTLSEVLYTSTKLLIERSGSLQGKSFLDLGCGGGNVALMAAKLIGDEGRVTAIDFDDEILELARKGAVEAGVKNIFFQTAGAYEIDFTDEFDVAYSRFLFSHLKNPLAVLRKMLQSVKAGGVVMVEDVEFSGHFCYPGCKAFDAYLQYYEAAARFNGVNAEIGPSLFGLFRSAGIEQVELEVIQPCFNKGAGKQMAWLTLDRIKNTLIEQRIADTQTIERTLKELQEFTEDENTIMSLPRIFRLWGRRAG